jgi:hypothetical protein
VRAKIWTFSKYLVQPWATRGHLSSFVGPF